MSYARGMFRLWLVLSCLWIATVAAFGYSNWRTLKQAAYVPEFMKDQNDPYEKYVLPECGTGNPNNAFADFCKPKSKDDPPGYVPPWPWEVAAEAEAARKAQELAVSTAKLAFIPPALIFVVGLGLSWAFRGFRPR